MKHVIKMKKIDGVYRPTRQPPAVISGDNVTFKFDGMSVDTHVIKYDGIRCKECLWCNSDGYGCRAGGPNGYVLCVDLNGSLGNGYILFKRTTDVLEEL